MEESPICAEEAINMLVESFTYLAEHACDLAYARKTLYDAYLLEGFSPLEALELCKML